MIDIIIPSSGRSSSVLTDIDDSVLYVPLDQKDSYGKYCNNHIETHGKHEFKNLAEKRQAIYEQYKNVFMVDDDISFVSRLYTEGNNRLNHLSPTESRDLIYETAENAKDAGTFLFGFGNNPNAKHFHTHNPIVLSSYINASAFGLLECDKLFFTNKTTAAESHWINLLNAYQNRFCWIDKRFCFAQEPNSTFFKPGGQTSKRTLDTEKADTIFLYKMFGNCVKLKKNNGDASIQHEFQRTIKFPF